MQQTLFLWLLGGLLLAAGCRPSPSASSMAGSVPEDAQQAAADSIPLDGNLVNPAEFDAWIRRTPEARILDVRTPEEFNTGFIAGAQNLDFSEPAFADKLAALDRELPYFIYCAAGGRSHRAYEMMQAQGFRQVVELEGGTTAWEAAGLPLQK